MRRTLSKDIRLLGDTLGEVVEAHGGRELFRAVERMRLCARRAREAHTTAQRARARRTLARLASQLDPGTSLEVVRAFTLYFRLVNLAEDVHRSREIRSRESAREVVDESLAAVLGELAGRGAARAEALEILGEAHLRFVFTAHPTEARRRTTERLLAAVRRSLERRDRSIFTPSEESREDIALRSLIESLWEHEAQRARRPEVLSEVRAGLWYLEEVLLDVVPQTCRELWRAFESYWGPADPTQIPMPLSFGSWMGSDRDGNPYVTDAVTERTLEMQRRLVIDRYIADVLALIDPLAGATPRITVGPRVERALEAAAAALPDEAARVQQRNPSEPLRCLLSFVVLRLERARSHTAGGYRSSAQLLDDLCALRETLRASRAKALPNDRLLDLIFRVRCFGFHLVSLDVREDSRVHRRVVAELLGDADYPSRSSARRTEALRGLRLPADTASLSAETRRLLDLFVTIRRQQALLGPDALGTYAISMCESPADVFEVVRLAELHGCRAQLDFVPLFETAGALRQAGDHLDRLLTDEGYRSHVKDRGDLQELLVGYSDSMKESGILASRSLVLSAQRDAARALDRHGVRLRMFHGRGGSVSRGGGPTYRAIRSLPRDAFSGTLKITEQGETRAQNFAAPDLARRYLEQTLGATLIGRFEARREDVRSTPEQDEILVRLAEAGRNAYRGLVEDPGLIRFFLEATPFDAITTLHMASRPARRGRGESTLDDLRAIPWVFAWSQSRAVVTAWYGVGTALDAVAQSGAIEPLRQMYERWPFFRDLLENVEMTLAKTDLEIASGYAQLCADEAIRSRIFGKLREEFERTLTWLSRITGRDDLMSYDPIVQRSLRLRSPYVDPLSYLQVHALRQMRGAEGHDDWQRVASAAVLGIAAGLRNTG